MKWHSQMAQFNSFEEGPDRASVSASGIARNKAWMLDQATLPVIDKIEHLFSRVLLARDGLLAQRLTHQLTQKLWMLRRQLCSSKRTH